MCPGSVSQSGRKDELMYACMCVCVSMAKYKIQKNFQVFERIICLCVYGIGLAHDVCSKRQRKPYYNLWNIE